MEGREEVGEGEGLGLVGAPNSSFEKTDPKRAKINDLSVTGAALLEGASKPPPDFFPPLQYTSNIPMSLQPYARCFGRPVLGHTTDEKLPYVDVDNPCKREEQNAG
jgi:hypothetical protein